MKALSLKRRSRLSRMTFAPPPTMTTLLDRRKLSPQDFSLKPSDSLCQTPGARHRRGPGGRRPAPGNCGPL